MQEASVRPFKTAAELHAELEWAAGILTGDAADTRIRFGLPTLAQHGGPYNWDVDVVCRPDQDDSAQAAIQHVADRWQLTPPGLGTAQTA